jgi:hypothetical protein
MGASAWFHPDLAAEPRLVGPVIRALARILQTGTVLHPKIKALKGPWPGTHRLRFAKKERALFSWEADADGQRVAWVHEIDWRAEVYERDAGLARATAWADARDRRGLNALGYVRKEAGEGVVDEPEPDVLPALSHQQSRFIQSLLPLEQKTRSPLAFVRLGVGPPGSGKTVVAVDAAQAAQELDYDVLVLVPSPKLLRTYRDELGRVAVVEEGRFAEAPSDDQPRVWVERVGDFFDAVAGSDAPGDAVRVWWADALKLPAVQKWRKKHPCVEALRFVDLIDAVLFDERAGGVGGKDALAEQDTPLRAAIADLSGGLRDAVVQLKQQRRVVLRWERARSAVDKLAAARPGRSLLILVDEAQDLIPAQWQALASAAFRRLTERKDTTGLALLGDENQRVTPTAFAWNDVKAFVAGLHPDLQGGIGVEMTDLPGSFRIPRAVARVANPLVDGRMDSGVRRASVVEPESLLEEGGVEIVEVSEIRSALLDAVGALVAEGLAPEARLLVITDKQGAGHPVLDTLDVVEAKGLEWDAIVVAGLFSTKADFNERARAYTRLTRARKRVVLLVSPNDGRQMEVYWTPYLRAEGTEGVRRVEPADLASALRRCIDTSSAVDRVDELLSRIGNVLERAEQEGGGCPTPVIELVERVIPLGGAARVPAIFDDFLDRNAAWEVDLRAAGLGAGARVRAASVLAAGDVGEALALAERLPELTEWVAPLTRAVEGSGALARASAELRRSGVEDAMLEDLIRVAFRGRVVQALARRKIVDAPVAPPADLVAPRITRRVWTAVEQERAKIAMETDRLSNAAEELLDAGIRRVEAEVSASAVLQSFRDVEAGLARLEQVGIAEAPK